MTWLGSFMFFSNMGFLDWLYSCQGLSLIFACQDVVRHSLFYVFYYGCPSEISHFFYFFRCFRFRNWCLSSIKCWVVFFGIKCGWFWHHVYFFLCPRFRPFPLNYTKYVVWIVWWFWSKSVAMVPHFPRENCCCELCGGL